MYEGKIWKPISLMEKETIVKSNFFISHADFCDEFIRNLNKNAKIFKIDDITKDEYFNIKREPVKNSILFIAYPTKTKGLKELILTFNEIYFQYDDIKIIVVGNYDENYKKSLLSLLKSHEAKDKIIFKGFLSNQNLLIEFSKADLFVFPSYFETSPNVIMEAMSAGVPIITTNVGGIPDMISDGYTGLLVEPKNSVDLKSKITFLLDNPELKVFLGNNARIEAKKRFKNKIVVEKVLSAYKYVIDNSNKIK
jgi:glycosyltransferase involved in cell wall biosynthesis